MVVVAKQQYYRYNFEVRDHPCFYVHCAFAICFPALLARCSLASCPCRHCGCSCSVFDLLWCWREGWCCRAGGGGSVFNVVVGHWSLLHCMICLLRANIVGLLSRVTSCSGTACVCCCSHSGIHSFQVGLVGKGSCHSCLSKCSTELLHCSCIEPIVLHSEDIVYDRGNSEL